MRKRLFILDGHYLVYRSYYAMLRAELTDSRGQPTGAVFALLRLLLELFKKYEPDYVVCAMDSTEPTFRHEFYEDYKLDRPEMPDDLKAQLPQIKKLFKLLEIPVLIEPGFESDDLIASMVEKWSDKDEFEIVVVSNDKDLFQLVDDSVRVLKQKQGLTDVVLLDDEGVKEQLGVAPEKVADFLSLVGDKADNVPGVEGIGPVYGSRLIDKFGTVENMLENIDEIPERFRGKIKESQQQLVDSKHLVLLRRDAPLELDLEDASFEELPVKRLISFCRDLGFNSLRRKLEEKADLPSDWEKIVVEYKKTTLTEFSVELTDADSIYGYVFNCEPELKAMEAKNFYFVLKSNQEVWLIPFNILTMGEKEKVKFVKLAHKCLSKEFFTYHNKLLQICLLRIGEDLPPGENVFDLQLASYLVSPDLAHEFKDIILREQDVAVPEFDPEREQAEVCDYLARSLILLEESCRSMEKRIEEENQSEILRELEIPLTAVLARMEYNGIKLDSDKLRGLSEELGSVLSKLRGEAYELAGEEFNLNSPKQMREIFFDKLGFPVQGKTSSGKPSTDADTLQKLSEDYRLPSVILEYRKYSKIESTYLEPLIEAVNERTRRIHTEFNQTVAGTGRLSSSRPNLQNIPVREKFGRRVREAFVPSRSDYILLGADYSQIELRLLAHMSGDETLLTAFKEGRDIHSITAAELTGKNESEISKKDRRTAKVVNFGIAYGLSAFGLARDLDISRKEAKEYIERYFNRYPGVKKFIDDTVKTAKKQGYVETLWGRRRYVPELSSDDFFRRQFGRRAAVNAPIQGTSADMLKKAMIELMPELERFECNLLLQVHDELILEVKREESEELESVVRRVMRGAMDLKVPVLVNIIQGSNWAEISK